MIEQKIATRLDDMFSDRRINLYVLAIMTRRLVNPHAIDIISSWLDIHKGEPSTHNPYSRIDLDSYRVD